MVLELTNEGWQSVAGDLAFLLPSVEKVHRVFYRFDSAKRSHVLSWIDNKTSLEHSKFAIAGLYAWDKEALVIWHKGGE